ncbi:hypothetical protein L1987_10645 [Smallanthus sonchifolius]|uniref:Uncharacterized protein n=1 Tax=Smallanthus sonchifolius TaxID=185202 RepID=A0ACB9J9P0_9ASTR|nr:hypothetical protein L1987_10645 [Smallanthus sonchifolius]
MVHKNHALKSQLFLFLAGFDEILQEADGIILSRGNLPPEKVPAAIKVKGSVITSSAVICCMHGLAYNGQDNLSVSSLLSDACRSSIFQILLNWIMERLVFLTVTLHMMLITLLTHDATSNTSCVIIPKILVEIDSPL